MTYPPAIEILKERIDLLQGFVDGCDKEAEAFEQEIKDLQKNIAVIAENRNEAIKAIEQLGNSITVLKEN